MIIIKVQGGLGNQLLQYSIGRVLATSLGKDVAYDFSFYEGETKYTKRPYLLDKFHTRITTATKEEIKKVKYPLGVVSKVVVLVRKALNKYFFKKYYVGYNKNFLEMVQGKETLYLEGFWQSFEYYKNSLALLSEEISLQDETNLRSAKDAISFKGKESVSVHIRRGDYLNAGTGISVLSKEYYASAVAIVMEKVSNPMYIVFSDDINWVKQEMGHLFKDVVYASDLSLSDYEEFSLMKECRHAIIANSTFSWFSTLLTDRDDKVVVYSNDWKNEYLNGDTHICPKHWIFL